MGDHDRRLGRLEQEMIGTVRAAEAGPPALFLFPDLWPDEDRLAFDGDDPTMRRAMIERHAGERPGTETTVFAYRLWTPKAEEIR